MAERILVDTFNNFRTLHVQRDSPISFIMILIKNGARHETEELSGISHFVEHMMFKQTEKRSTEEIHMEIETLGGDSNAFTGYEYTGYYIKVLEEHFDSAFDILADMLQNGKFEPQDIETERGNIIEEIRMIKDSPRDLLFDIMKNNIFPESSLGRPILGTEENVSRFNRENLLEFINSHYLQDDILVVSAGKFGIERTRQNIERLLLPRKSGSLKINQTKFQPKEKVSFHSRPELTQAHMVISFEGTSFLDDNIYSYDLLDSVLGYGMGSIMYLLLREKLGVAYYVGTYNEYYEETGSFHIYFGTNVDKAADTVEEVFQTLDNIKKSGISEEQLARAKNLTYSSYTMSRESISYLAKNHGLRYLLTGKIETPEEVKKKIYSVSSKELQDIANRIFNDNYNITYIAGKPLL